MSATRAFLRHSFVFLTCATATALLAGHHVEAQDNLPGATTPATILDGISVLRLSARVTAYHPADSSVYESKLEESYSLEQQRAKISYDIMRKSQAGMTSSDQHQQGQFYMDSTLGHCVILSLAHSTCRKSTPTALQNLLHFMFPSEAADSQRPYIVGAAKLLLFIERHREEFQLVNLRNSIEVSNVKCLLYEFSYEPESGGKMRITVAYSEAALARDKNTQPLQVTTSKKDGTMMVLMLSQIHTEGKHDINSQMLNSYKDRNDLSESVALDEFVLGLQSGCAHVIQENLDAPFKSRSNELKTLSFSFIARQIIMSPRLRRPLQSTHFVAYSGDQRSLRVDSFDHGSRRKTTPDKRILNFETNRIYHVSKDWSNEGQRSRLETGGKAHCVSSLLGLAYDARNSDHHSPAKLLAGPETYVYMGRARVRDIDALVFESVSDKLPLWLDTPVVYEDKKSKSSLRTPERTPGKTIPTQYCTTLYLSAAGGYSGAKNQTLPNGADQRVPYDHLLIIEIYELSSLSGGVPMTVSKRVIMTQQFTWQLSESPEGDPAKHLFSLADDCSLRAQSSDDHARALVVFEELPPKDPNVNKYASSSMISISALRDLALVGGLQRVIGLPVNMIKDLVSKVTRAHNSHLNTVIASFSLSQPANEIASLVYTGQGAAKAPYSSKQSLLVIDSFADCYMIAAHANAEVYFGFNPIEKLCYIDFEAIAPVVNNLESSPSFVWKESADMEIYRITMARQSTTHKNTCNWITENSPPESRIKFLGKVVEFNIIVGFVEYQLKRVDVELERFGDLVVPSSSKSQDSTTNQGPKIQGLGYATDQSLVYRRSMLPDEHGDRPPMTHSACQAACLADLECRSYSVCIREAELECLTSPVNLREASVLQQLQDTKVVKKKSPSGSSKFEVTWKSDDNDVLKNVTILQDSRCDLFNKLFVDLFRQRGNVRHTYTNRRVHQVANIETCAELCFYQSLEMMQAGLNRSQEAETKSTTETDKDDQTQDSRYLKDLIYRREELTRNICKSFLYIGREQLVANFPDSEEQIKKRVINSKVDGSSFDGYCMINARSSQDERDSLIESNKHEPEKVSTYITFEKFELRGEIFFEKQHGVSLKASNMIGSEFQAYNYVTSKKAGTNYELDSLDQAYHEQAYTTMRRFIERGENIQEVISSYESECALICFTQSWGPWPACKSFDILVRHNSYGNAVVKCQLNSITMAEAVKREKFTLINNEIKQDEQMSHYDPRTGLVVSQVNFEQSLALATMNYIAKLRSTIRAKVKPVTIFMIVLISIVVGVPTGLFVGMRQIAARRDIEMRRGSIAPIMVRSGSVEFVNQVTHECTIPE